MGALSRACRPSPELARRSHAQGPALPVRPSRCPLFGVRGARPTADLAAARACNDRCGAALDGPRPSPRQRSDAGPRPGPQAHAHILAGSFRHKRIGAGAVDRSENRALDQVLQAEAATRIALANYLPNLSSNTGGGGSGIFTHQIITNTVSGGFAVTGNGVTTSTRVPLPNTFACAAFKLQQDLINVPLCSIKSASTSSNEDATKLSVEDKKRTLALSLANQIVSVVTAERSAEINRVGLRVALEQLEITRRKQSLGAAMGLDVVRAEQNAANARATLVSGDEALREAREALGLAPSASPKRPGSHKT